MWVSRMRVSGGFLSGLDLQLSQGLNVIVGGRGAGKTTLLELIRHAMGLPFVDTARSQPPGYISAMLGDGHVVLDVVNERGELERLVVDAQGSGRTLQHTDSVLMISQNELEAVASDASSRLQLLDRRANVQDQTETDERVTVSTLELHELRLAISASEEVLQSMSGLEADIADAQRREADLLSASSSDTSRDRDQAARLEEAARAAGARRRNLVRFRSDLAETKQLLDALSESVSELAEEAHATELSFAVTLTDRWRLVLTELGTSAEEAQTGTQMVLEKLQNEEARIQTSLQPLRDALDKAEEGLGLVASEIQRLSELRLALNELNDRRSRDLARVSRLTEARDTALDRRELESEGRFSDRLRVAEEVSMDLENRVRVSVDHLADTRTYSEFLINSMRGSSLQYRGLVERISSQILPRTLLTIIETGAVARLAELLGVTDDRAARVLEHLDKPVTLAELAVIQIEDRADFWLVEAARARRVDELSTGQKCAVTLPLLLADYSRALIVDQPEDHLDNAYLVANIVTSFEARSRAGTQSIVATHNANIPVLGEADLVVALASDGTRGYVQERGRFDRDEIVDRITTVMEGGADAFRRRAMFYKSHGMSIE